MPAVAIYNWLSSRGRRSEGLEYLYDYLGDEAHTAIEYAHAKTELEIVSVLTCLYCIKVCSKDAPDTAFRLSTIVAIEEYMEEKPLAIKDYLNIVKVVYEHCNFYIFFNTTFMVHETAEPDDFYPIMIGANLISKELYRKLDKHFNCAYIVDHYYDGLDIELCERYFTDGRIGVPVKRCLCEKLEKEVLYDFFDVAEIADAHVDNLIVHEGVLYRLPDRIILTKKVDLSSLPDTICSYYVDVRSDTRFCTNRRNIAVDYKHRKVFMWGGIEDLIIVTDKAEKRRVLFSMGV